jgi:hypothetical protein
VTLLRLSQNATNGDQARFCADWGGDFSSGICRMASANPGAGGPGSQNPGTQQPQPPPPQRRRVGPSCGDAIGEAVLSGLTDALFFTGVGAAAKLGRLSSLLFREAASLSERGLYQQTGRFTFAAARLARDLASERRPALIPGHMGAVAITTTAAGLAEGSGGVSRLGLLDFLPVTGTVMATIRAVKACR